MHVVYTCFKRILWLGHALRASCNAFSCRCCPFFVFSRHFSWIDDSYTARQVGRTLREKEYLPGKKKKKKIDHIITWCISSKLIKNDRSSSKYYTFNYLTERETVVITFYYPPIISHVSEWIKRKSKNL